MLYLTEDMVGPPPYDADNLYGWAKLMGEKTLGACHDHWGMKSVSCRYFTFYGERGHENHAVMTMIARAFIGQDPLVGVGHWRADPELDPRRRHRVGNDPRRGAHRGRHRGEPGHHGALAKQRLAAGLYESGQARFRDRQHSRLPVRKP
jgi:hypothetical protein